MLNDCQLFDSKTNQKEHKLHKNDDVEIIKKTAISSWEKPTRQRIRATLKVFKVLIHDVRQNFDKTCNKF